MDLVAYPDSDLGNSHSRKSTTGGIAGLYGPIIATQSKTQGTISLSSGESEFNALVLNSQTILHIREVFSETGYQVKSHMVLTDSSVAIQIVFQNSNSRSKSIDRKMSWIKNEVKEQKSLIHRHVGGTAWPIYLKNMFHLLR